MESEKFYYRRKILAGTNIYKGADQINNDILKDLCINNDNMLMIAQAGSGKTYSTIEVAKQLIKEDRFLKVILAVPTTEQAKQISKDKTYNIPYYVGETKQAHELEKNICVCVYDSLDKVFTLTDWSKSKDTLLIVDEAHKLVTDINYRSKAIKPLFEIAQETRTIYMTATPKPIENFEFNKVIEFIDLEKTNNYKECYLYNYKEGEQKELLRVLNTVFKSSKFKDYPILIFNDGKEENKKTEKTLKKAFKNLKIAQLNADTKQAKEMQAIKDKSILEGADIYLATAILEQGTNINNNAPILVIYLMDSKNPSYTKLLQSVARPRNPLHTCIIMRKQQEEATIASDMYYSIGEIEKNIKLDIEYLNMCVEVGRKQGRTLDTTALKKGVTLDNTVKRTNIDYHSCILYNNATGYYEIDQLRLYKELNIEKDKIDFSNNTTHKVRVKGAVKSDKYFTLAPPPPIDDLEKAYKEVQEEQKEINEINTEFTLLTIKHLDENVYYGLLDKYNFGSYSKHNLLKDSDKLMIESILNYPKILKVIAGLEACGIDAQGLISNDMKDIKELEKALRIENNKEFNRTVPIGAIKGLKSELSNQSKFRMILDENIGKELNKKIELQLYKVYNPIKAKTLTTKQRDRLLSIIQEFCNARFKDNKQIYIGKLLV